ncbi:DUF3027 domain-containing protein [Haloechinothrix sp. LS1_15]|uniref:DUF3027 domain-containing protein n=1 Tax=Haloechinothrix sp. LS1_15 TaxID=2652248 RepID=UPI0029478A62|nr:DUF3027 domain-containing protein [Haloechinothrix sp. LS1_15]MDV6014369.1 DUF3027 domain-containing protein [Haloechinothrix sp. LS1_15]
MTSTPTAPPRPGPQPASWLIDAVDVSRSAAWEEASERGYDPDAVVGEYVGVEYEDDASVTHRFEATVPGYGGWQWHVTVAGAGEDLPVTVSEVMLRPGPHALVAKEWVPWERRVRPGDLGIGDVLPTREDDDRLVPGHIASGDDELDELVVEPGLGRARVMSLTGRLAAAARWRAGEFGPRSDMARSAPQPCGTCGFYLPLAGSLRAAFGVCGNDVAPADGHVVHVEYGCGAHSEIEVSGAAAVPVADLVYDDSRLEIDS